MVHSGKVSPRALRALVAITLVAAVPRVVGSFDAFWLDEIWSLQLASRVQAPWQVFTALHHDNNHYLITLWMRLVGPDIPWPLYRLPALLAGVATVFLAGWVEFRGGLVRGVLASTLVGISYPLVQYSSEARGYAVVVLLAIAAYGLLAHHHRTGNRASALLFGLVSALGFLAHLTFLTVYVPLLGWSVWAVVSRRDAPPRFARLMGAHLLPIAVVLLLILVDVRYLVRGGGPELPPLVGWYRSWFYALGLPFRSLPGAVFGALFLALVGLGLREQMRDGDGSWVFFILVLAFPLALLLALRTGYAPPRYFLASLVFGLLLVGRGLVVLLRGSVPTRILGGVLIGLLLAGNGLRDFRFLRDGRGAYREAVRYLSSHTLGDTIRVASDHDFQSSMVLGYYSRFLPGDDTLEYVDAERERDEPAEWFLTHGVGAAFRPADTLAPAMPGVSVPVPYTLQRVFPQYGLSGWKWALYRRARSP